MTGSVLFLLTNNPNTSERVRIGDKRHIDETNENTNTYWQGNANTNTANQNDGNDDEDGNKMSTIFMIMKWWWDDKMTLKITI